MEKNKTGRKLIYIAILTLVIAVVLSSVILGLGHIFGTLGQTKEMIHA